MTKINNLKRQAFKSRTSLKRKFENAGSKNEKRRKLEGETEEHFLHTLLKETMFANVKKCAKCQCNCSSYSATEVTEDQLDGNADIMVSRRFGKFWLCKFCIDTEKNHPHDVRERSSTFKMKASIIDDQTYFRPTLIRAEDEDEMEDTEEMSPVQVPHLNPVCKVSFPVDSKCLDSYPQDIQLKSLGHSFSSYCIEEMV